MRYGKAESFQNLARNSRDRKAESIGEVVQNDKGQAHKGLANDGKDMGRGDITIGDPSLLHLALRYHAT